MVIRIIKNLKIIWILKNNMNYVPKEQKYEYDKEVNQIFGNRERVFEEKPDWNDGSWILHKLNTNLRWEIPPTEWGMHKTNKNRILGRKKPSHSVKINSKFQTNVNIMLKTSETLWQALTWFQRYEPMGSVQFKPPKGVRRKDLLSFTCFWTPRASSLSFTQTSW